MGESRKIHGKTMYPLYVNLNKREAKNLAQSHRDWRNKMGYRKGTSIIKRKGKWAVFSAIMSK